jgi:hypothetical protein
VATCFRATITGAVEKEGNLEVKQTFRGPVGTVWNVETLNLVGDNGVREVVNLRQEKRARTADQHEAIKKLGEAEVAAQSGTPSKVVEKLRAAGSWIADVAKELGSSVIAKLIEGQLHLG